MGDPCGIGPDIILAAWTMRAKAGLPDFLVTGDPDFLARRAGELSLDVPLQEIAAPQDRERGALGVVPTRTSAIGRPAHPADADARATIEAVDLAVNLVFSGKAAAVVTAPINKETLYSIGFSHPGHTEYLAELAGNGRGGSFMPVMMLAGPRLRTIPITIHEPLHRVPQLLTTELVAETLRIAARDLTSRFGIESPRLAVAGLNPHAGENGTIGSEEQHIIAPAIEALRSEGVNVRGPLPADTMFHEAARKTYDVAVCMYHDQALIPAKALDFDDAVNVTLGLPFVRTSPDHGTAYDIAGTGTANPASFVAALHMAHRMVARS